MTYVTGVNGYGDWCLKHPRRNQEVSEWRFGGGGAGAYACAYGSVNTHNMGIDF